jgi:hypothetical protein
MTRRANVLFLLCDAVNAGEKCGETANGKNAKSVCGIWRSGRQTARAGFLFSSLISIGGIWGCLKPGVIPDVHDCPRNLMYAAVRRKQRWSTTPL